MRGHIKERSPGKWAIVLDQRNPETGQRKRKWHAFQGTKREAQKECARLITTLQSGDYVEPAKETLSQFFERWLEHIRLQVSPRSHERYTEIARKNLAPLLGGAVLTKLRPEQISSAYGKALVSGRRDGTGGLAPRTVHHMHRILRQALSQAVKWRILIRNPAEAVDPPKVERRKMRALDATESAALFAHFRPTRVFMPVLLGTMCGLRRGEITALRWRSVDWKTGNIEIVESTEQTRKGTRSKETKSGRGRRVALPSFALEELRAHYIRQAEELLKLGMRGASDGYVYTQADGSPVQPNSLTHEFTRILAQATHLPRVRFHDLRHSHATQMLASGVHPKIAQERLGHSSIAITLDLYSHVLPGMQEDAAAKVDAALRAAIGRTAG